MVVVVRLGMGVVQEPQMGVEGNMKPGIISLWSASVYIFVLSLLSASSFWKASKKIHENDIILPTSGTFRVLSFKPAFSSRS